MTTLVPWLTSVLALFGLVFAGVRIMWRFI